MNHLELIVKDGHVTIPSIFMFEHHDEMEAFVEHARKQNCVVVFENENIKASPDNSLSIRFKLLSYAGVMNHHEIGNDYCRYLENIKDMTWDKVKNDKVD